jgi:hypothetical protein
MILGEFDPLPAIKAGGVYTISWKITENVNQVRYIQQEYTLVLTYVHQALLFNFKKDCQNGAAEATMVFSGMPQSRLREVYN